MYISEKDFKKDQEIALTATVSVEVKRLNDIIGRLTEEVKILQEKKERTNANKKELSEKIYAGRNAIRLAGDSAGRHIESLFQLIDENDDTTMIH